jgi:hypothetical protein
VGTGFRKKPALGLAPRDHPPTKPGERDDDSKKVITLYGLTG